MKNTDVVLEFVNVNNAFLHTISALMIYVKESLNSSMESNLSFGEYKNQLHWKIISTDNKRVILNIRMNGCITVVYQEKLSDTEKTALDTSQDFLPPDLTGANGNTFEVGPVHGHSELEKMMKGIKEYLSAVPA